PRVEYAGYYMDGARAPAEGAGAGAVDGVGAAAGAAAARTNNACRGKLKLPPVSSMTLTWQMYRPAVRLSSGMSKAKATAPRPGTFRLLASTSGVSKTFVVPCRNSMLVSTCMPALAGAGGVAAPPVLTALAAACVDAGS